MEGDASEGRTKSPTRPNVYNEKVGIDELGSNVFAYNSPSQRVKFAKTRKKIAEYACRNYGREQYELIVDGVMPEVMEPTEPTIGANGKFDEVELYWLLNGKGNFPMQASPISENISKPDSLPNE